MIDDEGGEKLATLAWTTATLAGAADPVSAVSAINELLRALFGCVDLPMLLHRDFEEFVWESLSPLPGRVDGLEAKAHRQQWSIDDLQAAVAQLKAAQDLTATELIAVLAEVRRLWSSTIDPKKRELIAAALRSSLLDREKYQEGLRRRFLEILGEVEVGDVLVLDALANPDDEVKITRAGFKRRRRPGGPGPFESRGPDGIVDWHLGILRKQGLAIAEGDMATQLGKLFLGFLEHAPTSPVDPPQDEDPPP